ncbi:LysR family transcriptional regulator [Actibacterium sp. 188UL27-1]|uniref:LysR family transcriptional regulator n=1 Tax=Actibacterium sp. 188UL27-1 TaxID=2786961 RepID=UPI00195E6D3D|nr:LysR family transcriptional regulator [Actibacterium sp. 188UL27-1]MBM7068940.1 LysR family transcriptional regulator [Actibacterium sp. 188UL27-1]
MLDFRDMELLAALARHGHFGRAAEACGITQPAFSTRIRNLEQRLGTPIVRRGHRFAGFTAEGEIALRWARRFLQEAQSMRQDLTAARTGLTGMVRIGVVPTAATFAAQATILLRREHPGLNVELRSCSSDQIKLGLTDMSLDLGVTYLRTRFPPGIETRPLYDERYELIAPRRLVDPLRETITWTEAAELPLCLLSSDMNNRKIIDQVFTDLGVTPDLELETNAFTAALVQAAAGLAATIAPEKLVETLPIRSELVGLPLTDPDVSEPIGLALQVQEPPSATTTALIQAFTEAAS